MHSDAAISFRQAEIDDADMVREVVRAAYSKWIPAIGREPRPMVVDYSIAVHEHDIDLAFVGPALVGLIETCPRTDHLWIENVAVVPTQQGNGFGRALLAHAERKAIQAGYSEVRLLTNAAFQANVTLYERVGYVIGSREPFMGGTTVYMNKKLMP